MGFLIKFLTQTSRPSFLALLLAGLLAFGPCSPAIAEGELVVGIFPRRPALQTEKMFAPLAKYLGVALDMPVRLEVPPDFLAFWKAVSQGGYQLVHYNPYHYVRSHKEYGYQVVAMNEEYGEREIRSTLWVRKDSNIHSAADLRHQKIVFGGGRKAMVSYIMATDLLRQAGLEDSDYITQFTINPTHALVAVYYHQGVAAGLNLTATRQPLLQSKVDFDEMKPLLVSEPVAMHPWAVSPEVDEQLQRRITTALLYLNDTEQGRAILHQADLTGLAPASDADYDPHRRIIERVLQEHY
jgi:phosphonate transport system substrate-binding protein